MSKVLIIEEYSEKSFVVRGDTKPHSNKLKDLLGSYNPRLRGGPGWIFANKNRGDVEDYISRNNIPIEINPTLPSQINREVNREVNREIKSKDVYENFTKILERLEKKIDKLLCYHSQTEQNHRILEDQDFKEEEDIKPKKRLLGNKI